MVIREAWLQFLSGRFSYTMFDKDDYKRQALNYCIYRFKAIVNEEKRNALKK